MHRLVIFAFVMAATLSGQSSQPSGNSTDQPSQKWNPPSSWVDSYRNATISFGRVVEDHGQRLFQVVGTGIFIAIVANGESHLFLVTAKHMFYESSLSWHPTSLQVRFASEEKESQTEQLGAPVQLRNANGDDLWLSPLDGADIAALRISASQFQQLSTHDGRLFAIPISNLADPDDIYDGASILVLGYPGLVGNSTLVRAITRGGYIAWTDPSGASTHPFLIDATILPGNSGGPVIKFPNGIRRDGGSVMGDKAKLLGIVSQDISQRYEVTADGKVVKVQSSAMSPPSVAEVQFTGVGAIGKVEPAPELKRFLLSLVH